MKKKRLAINAVMPGFSKRNADTIRAAKDVIKEAVKLMIKNSVESNRTDSNSYPYDLPLPGGKVEKIRVWVEATEDWEIKNKVHVSGSAGMLRGDAANIKRALVVTFRYDPHAINGLIEESHSAEQAKADLTKRLSKSALKAVINNLDHEAIHIQRDVITAEGGKGYQVGITQKMHTEGMKPSGIRKYMRLPTEMDAYIGEAILRYRRHSKSKKIEIRSIRRLLAYFGVMSVLEQTVGKSEKMRRKVISRFWREGIKLPW